MVIDMHTCFYEHLFILSTSCICIIHLCLELGDGSAGLFVLILCLSKRSVFGFLLVGWKAPVPVAAADLLDANLVVVGESLQVVLDLHTIDGRDLWQRLLEVFDAVSLCRLVEPCENRGGLLRVGLGFGRPKGCQ